ncbi:MAG TPA: LemA family protein [Pirellulales bacterium]|jgi:LemA protein|nr:LemA family protein [Pirellulales bacterium]
MKPFYAVLLVVALVIVLGIGMWISAYGALNAGNQTVKESWSNVQSTLQRRADLIPNLVNTVKGYATHEEKTLTEVTEARSKIGSVNIAAAVNDPQAMKQLQEAQQQMAGALSHLIAVAEQYPNLKADQNFLTLQSELEGTENRINVAREHYNEDARTFNTKVNGFFARFVANSYGFKSAEYFEAAPEAQKVPEVKF